jgi:hypothetical protein
MNLFKEKNSGRNVSVNQVRRIAETEGLPWSWLKLLNGYWCTNSQTFLNHTIPVFCILDSSHLSTRPVVVPMYVSMVIFNKFAIPLVDMSLRTISWYIPVKKIVHNTIHPSPTKYIEHL